MEIGKIDEKEIKENNEEVENTAKNNAKTEDKPSEKTPVLQSESVVGKVINLTAGALGGIGTISLSVIIADALASLVGIKVLYMALILLTSGVLLGYLFNYLTTGAVFV